MTIERTLVVERKVRDVADARAKRPLGAMRVLAEEADPVREFGCALLPMSDTPVRIIVECKTRPIAPGSTATGPTIAERARFAELCGAAAISVPMSQVGIGIDSGEIRALRNAVALPVLLRDLVIDEYQIFEARSTGADSYTLLPGILDLARLQYFIEIGRDLGMEPVVVCLDKIQLELALRTDAKILGLGAARGDTGRSQLAPVPELAQIARAHGRGRILVCLSDIQTREDIQTMARYGFRAFLVNEALITKDSHAVALHDLVSALIPR